MVAVFVLDRHKRCKFINSVAEFVTGVQFKQAVGRPFEELVWRGTPYAFEQTHLARALNLGKAEEGETTLSDNTGAKRPFSFRVYPLDEDVAGAVVVELMYIGGETGAARALRESERRLRLAAEATGIGIWEVNVVTGQRRWSAELTAVLGLPPDTVPSTELFSSLIHPDDRSRVDDMYSRLYSERADGRYAAEFRIRRASDGAERWVAATGVITHDADGKPLRGIGTLRDIHDRRTSEAALQASEARLRMALSAGRMGLWRHDLTTGAQEWDSAQYQLLGIDPAELSSYELFLSRVHPEDAAALALDSMRDGADDLHWEYRIIHPDGEIRWIAAYATIHEAGGSREMIGVSRDITEQKASALALKISEERLRLAVEANDIGTWDYDMVRGTHEWSPQFKALWGLPPEAPNDPELAGKLLAPEDRDALQRAWADATDAERGTGRIAIEYPIHRADTGERRWCSFAGNISFDAARRPVRAVGILMDITSRRRTEERQRRLLREMHHRVNNNLAIMQAILSQTLKSRIPRSEAFERIQARLMCLARVHELLGRSEVGTVPLGVLLSREVEFAGGPPTRLAVKGDPVDLDSGTAMMLGLVFHELASNAIRYGAFASDEGTIDVDWQPGADNDNPRVDIRWREQSGRKVRLPNRDGFGFRIIKTSINGTPGARAEVDATDSGLEWTLGIPLRPTPDEVRDLAGKRASSGGG